jgi:hypothetical protein
MNAAGKTNRLRRAISSNRTLPMRNDCPAEGEPNMGTANLDQLMEQVRALSPSAQWRLLEFLDALLAIPPGSPAGEQLSEDDFENQLVHEGVISVPPPRTDVSSLTNWKPVEIQGKPLSETIIEERRRVANSLIAPSASNKREGYG